MPEVLDREEAEKSTSSGDPAASRSRLARYQSALSGRLRFARASSVLAVSAFIVILVASLWVRVSFIRESLPYCRHPDEKTWSEIAMRITRDGDLNPHRFTKPSVMVYLTTAGLALGLIRAGSRGEAAGPQDLGKRAFPYYRVPSAIEVPKVLIAIGSVAALGMAGVCAWLLARNKWLLAGTALLAAFSTSYFWHSWEYIGADIVGTFFILATLTHLLYEHSRRPDFARSLGFAAVHGLLAGLVLGSKYNLFPIVVPYLVHTVAYRSDRLISRWVVFFIATLLGFVISTPYALFSMDEFLDGAVREARHYATGHRGKFTEAGWSMFVRYLDDLRTSYGIPVLLAALGGLAVAFKRDFRLALVTFSFPFAFLAYMSSQRVYFPRNIVSMHLFVALAASIGLLVGILALGRFTEKFAPLARRPLWLRRSACFAPIVLFVLFGLPWRSAYAMYTQRIESRHLAERTILENVRRGTTLLVDEDLFMDTSALETKYRVTHLSLDVPNILDRFLDSKPGTILIAPLYEDHFLLREARQHDAEVLLNTGAGTVHPRAGAEEGDPKLVVLRRP